MQFSAHATSTDLHTTESKKDQNTSGFSVALKMFIVNLKYLFRFEFFHLQYILCIWPPNVEISKGVLE